jgi:hypothetical protein
MCVDDRRDMIPDLVLIAPETSVMAAPLPKRFNIGRERVIICIYLILLIQRRYATMRIGTHTNILIMAIIASSRWGKSRL